MNQNIDMSETRELLPKQSRTRDRDDDDILPSYKRIKESIPPHTPPSLYEQEDQEEEDESSSSNSSH